MAVVFTAIATVCFANPFASQVEVIGGIVQIDQSSPVSATIQYRLNAPADKVIVTIQNQTSHWNHRLLNSDVETGPAQPGTARGINTVVWDGQRDGGVNAGDGFYDITVTAYHNGFSGWTDISPNVASLEEPGANDLIDSCYFWGPRGAEAITDQSNANFGDLLIASGANVPSTHGSPKVADYDIQGIYILNSDMTLDGGTTSSAYATGNSAAGYGGLSSSSLYRPHLDPTEGKLWIGSYSDASLFVKQGDDQFSAASIHTPLGPGANSWWGDTNTLGVCAFGTGGSRVLYGPAEDYNPSGCGYKDLLRWDIGATDDDYDTTPVLFVPACGIGGSGTFYHLRDLDIMSSGTILLGNYRWDDGNSLSRISPNGPSLDWIVKRPALIAAGGDGYMQTGVSLNADESKVYGQNGYGQLYVFDLDGTVEYGGDYFGGWYGDGCTVDAADNALLCNAGAEEVRMISPPGANNYATTAYTGSIEVINSEVVDWAVFD